MGSYLQSHNSVKVAPRPALFQEALAGMVSSGGNSAGIGVEFGKLLPDELHLIGEAAVFELLLLFLGMAIESTSNIAAPRARIQTVDAAHVEHHGAEFLLDRAAQEIGPAGA